MGLSSPPIQGDISALEINILQYSPNPRNSLGTSLARVHLRIVSPTSPSFNPEMLDLCYNNTFQRRRQLSLGTLGKAENGMMVKDRESPAHEQEGHQQHVGSSNTCWSCPGSRGDAAGRAGLRLVLPTVVIAAPTPYDNCNR